MEIPSLAEIIKVLKRVGLMSLTGALLRGDAVNTNVDINQPGTGNSLEASDGSSQIFYPQLAEVLNEAGKLIGLSSEQTALNEAEGYDEPRLYYTSSDFSIFNYGKDLYRYSNKGSLEVTKIVSLENADQNFRGVATDGERIAITIGSPNRSESGEYLDGRSLKHLIYTEEGIQDITEKLNFILRVGSDGELTTVRPAIRGIKNNLLIMDSDSRESVDQILVDLNGEKVFFARENIRHIKFNPDPASNLISYETKKDGTIINIAKLMRSGSKVIDILNRYSFQTTNFAWGLDGKRFAFTSGNGDYVFGDSSDTEPRTWVIDNTPDFGDLTEPYVYYIIPTHTPGEFLFVVGSESPENPNAGTTKYEIYLHDVISYDTELIMSDPNELFYEDRRLHAVG